MSRARRAMPAAPGARSRRRWSGQAVVASRTSAVSTLEAHDRSAAHDEVAGDTRVEVLAGGLVRGGVAGQHDDVLTVGDDGGLRACGVGITPCRAVRVGS